MKKLLFLLLTIPLFLACSNDNNNNDGKGYLTNLSNAKEGIIGVWKTTVGGIYYYNYGVNGIRCAGFSPEQANDECAKYDILMQNNKYILRGYDIGDLQGTGEPIDRTLKVLNQDELIYINSNDNEVRFTRVK